MYTTILETIVGSTVHGTSVADGLEDLDLMAVVIEDQETFCGFGAKNDTWTRRTKPEGVRSEAGDTDWVGYGLRKFLSLAMKGNPSVLVPLFAPPEFTRVRTDVGRGLQELVPYIVSKACVAPFKGYITQQTERMCGTRGQKNVTRPELVAAYGYDTKYAGHIVRLALQGTELLETGRITLPMRPDERALCVKVRTGGFTFAEVQEVFAETSAKLDQAIAHSTLPDQPQTTLVEKWMLETYLSAWCASKLSQDIAIGSLLW